MPIKHSIARRIQRVFLVFATITTACFSLLILGYSWVIEDNIFNRLVAREADFIAAHHARTGEVVEPRPAFMTLYAGGWDDLPESVRRQRHADPRRIEFQVGRATTIHTREIPLGQQVAVLAANVSDYEVSRDYLPVVSLWLLAGVALCSLLAAWIAWLVARSAVLPLRRLTETVDAAKRIGVEAGFAARFGEDEVGFLAQTIESGMIHLQSALAREKDFTRDVSHELRTPTAVLALLADELDREKHLSPASKDLFRNTVVKLDQTIKTLLALARQENIALQETALLPILEDRIINHFELANDAAFDLQLAVPAQLKVVCNPHLVAILCDNVLTNAIRYASEPWLRIHADAEGLLFENATASENPEATKGIGQGMSLMQRVCDRFQWRMTVERTATRYAVRIGFSPASPVEAPKTTAP